MTIDEANEDENVKGIFTIEQIGQRASSKYAAGQIIEQSPKRGKTVKGNRVISVFVSSGAKTEKMPNLVNKEYRDATLQLTNLDLNLVVNDRSRNTAASRRAMSSARSPSLVKRFRRAPASRSSSARASSPSL